MRRILIMLIGPAMLTSSCKNSGGDARNSEEAHKPLSQRLGENNGYQKDSDGNWGPKSDKRSSFESQGASAYFSGEYKGKAYDVGEYKKKSWTGSREYSRQNYTGNTDGSRFQQSSRLQGQTAPDTQSQARIPDPYQTSSHATSTANENGGQRINRKSDAQTEISRQSYQQPEIIDWSQRRDITLDQSRGILGR
jgi:hypothetical protein